MKSKKLSRSKNKKYKKSTKHRINKTPKYSKKKTKSEIKKNRREKKRRKVNKEKNKVITLMNGGGCGCSASEKKNSMMEYMADLKHDLNVNIQGGGGYTVMPADNQHFSNIVEYNDNNPPEIKELRN